MKFIHARQCKHAGGYSSCVCVHQAGYTARGTFKNGDLVTLYDDFEVRVYGETVMLPGQVAQLASFSNEGFNGIAAQVIINGKYVRVPAGKLRKADDGASARAAIRAEYARRLKAVHAAAGYLKSWADEHEHDLDIDPQDLVGGAR